MGVKTEPYWWACGPDGWQIETWVGRPCAENVVIVGHAKDLDDAERLVRQMNAWLPLVEVP